MQFKNGENLEGEKNGAKNTAFKTKRIHGNRTFGKQIGQIKRAIIA